MLAVSDIVAVSEAAYMRTSDVGMIVSGPDMPEGIRYVGSTALWARWFVVFPDGEVLSCRETCLKLVSSVRKKLRCKSTKCMV